MTDTKLLLVENPVEPPTENPVENHTEPQTETPAENPVEPPTENPVENPMETHTEPQTETPAENPVENQTEPQTENPVENPVEPQTETRAENPVEPPPETTTLNHTIYGNSAYSHLWYVDTNNKLCITFTPRGGCSIAFQQYLDLVGLLSDGLKYDPFIHVYRCVKCHHNYINIDGLIAKKYTFIKFIMNPYIRAVTSYRCQSSHNLSFRQYLHQLINNEFGYFNDADKFHLHPQYIDGEENIITKYIKINENETYDITLQDGTLYTLDANRYTSSHHGKKNITNTIFCGDTPRQIISDNLPASYKYFYDDEIQKLVETLYKNDVDKYGFTFESAF